ncbi:porin family protein [candidate division WOR-3 bacterium]|nr:porin family protein [candidate division WOR-3 bacterium]
MRRLIPVMAVVMIAAPVFAGMGIGGFGNFSMPLGDFGDAAGMGFGGGVKFCYDFSPTLGLGVEAGYIMFGGETMDLGILGEWEYSYNMIPVLAGINYYVLPGPAKVYVTAGGGLYIVGWEVTIGDVSESDSESKFGFYGGIGMEYPFGESTSFNANVRFNHILTEGDATQFIAINAGVNYYFPVGL